MPQARVLGSRLHLERPSRAVIAPDRDAIDVAKEQAAGEAI